MPVRPNGVWRLSLLAFARTTARSAAPCLQCSRWERRPRCETGRSSSRRFPCGRWPLSGTEPRFHPRAAMLTVAHPAHRTLAVGVACDEAALYQEGFQSTEPVFIVVRAAAGDPLHETGTKVIPRVVAFLVQDHC